MYEYNSAKKEEEVLHPADDERTEGGREQAVRGPFVPFGDIHSDSSGESRFDPSTKQASAAIRVAAQVGHSRAKVSRLVALMKRAGTVKRNQISTEFHPMQST